jgi:hypothetical protein
MMLDRTTLRSAGLLLSAGLTLFSLAAIAGEPFQQATVAGLRDAIRDHPARYTWSNLLATAGFMILIVGFGTLGLNARAARPRLHLAGLGLLLAAAAFWMVEVVFRLGVASTGAGIPVTGADMGGRLDAPLGMGFNPVFLAFLTSALGGLAIVVWGLGQDRVLPQWLARAGAAVLVLSGVVAVFFFPWVGAGERALFYPLALIVVPAAAHLLLPRKRRPDRRPIARPFDAARG